MSLSESDSGSHGCGCFSIRIQTKRRQARASKRTKDTREGLKDDIAPTDEKSEKSDDGPPTVAAYALEATKQTIGILKGVAGLAPIPLVKEVLELGLTIIETCEGVNDVRNKVNTLKNRIAGFLLVIAKVAKDSDGEHRDEGSASKMSDDLRGDLLELKRCLDLITTKLNVIKDQNAFLTGVLSKPNLEIIDECESHFQAEVSRFQTLQSLYAAQDLGIIQQQLIKLYGITEEMALDVRDIQTKVTTMETSLNELVNILSKKGTDSEVATVLQVSRMPKSPDLFLGRDLVVQRVAEQLTCGDHTRSRVCIVGPGGMGKTSAALAIMEHDLILKAFPQQHRFWVPCIGANSPTLFLSILSKYIMAERKTGDPLNDIIATLQETPEPRIILLDNFETPWHPVEGSQSAIRVVLEALDALPHLSILVTMRSEFSPLEKWSCERLSQINSEDSRKIYTAIDPTAGNYPELDELLDALGHLPYAITLMASRGKRSLTNPTQLLEEWRQVGTSMLSRPEEGINHSIQLSIDSKFVRNSPNALRLLQILSMLPAGLYQEHLPTWAEGWQSEAVDTLRDVALVLAREVKVGDVTKVHLFVLPVVQSYMRQNGRTPKEVQKQVFSACYQFLAKNSVTSSGPDDPHFNKHALTIASQEANIQALLTNMIKDALTDTKPSPHPSSPSSTSMNQEQQLDALLAFSWQQYWVKPRPEIAEHVAALAQKFGKTRCEAASQFCLGSILADLVQCKPASDAFTKARTLFERLGDDLMVLRSDSMAVETAIGYDAGLNHIEKLIKAYRSRWKKHVKKDDTLKAWYLFHSGFLYWWAQKMDKALRDLQAAQQLFSQLNPPRKIKVAEIGYHVARSYVARGLRGDAEAALRTINSSIVGYRTLYGKGLVGVGPVHCDLMKARLLKGLNRWDEELDSTLKVALKAFQEVGESRGLAQTLIELAEIYVRKKEWPAAKLAYEEVIRKCSSLEDRDSTNLVDAAKHNLKYIAQEDSWERNGVGLVFWEPERV